MPSPGLRQLTIVLVTIVVQAAIGFTVDRTTETVVSTEYIADLATQASVQIKNVINPNDIRQDKDDTNKGTKNKNRFSSEEKHDDIEPTKSTSTDDVRTETDIPVANINAADVITNRYNNEVPSTEGFSADTTTFDSQTTDILTPTESTTSHNEYVTDADLLVSSINITNIENINSTADPSHIKKENISLSSIVPSRIGTKVNNVTGLPTINDQIAIDTQSMNNLNDSSALPNVNSTSDNTKKVDLKIINTQTPPTVILDAPGYKPEGGKLVSQESIEGISQKDLFLAEQKVVQALNQITTESTREEFTSTDGGRVLTLKEASLRNEKQNNMVEAETRQTTLSIPSLENLREHLFSNNNQRSRITDLELSMATEAIPASELIVNTQQETATVVSKRAGFLDFSKKSFTNDYEGGTAEDSTKPLATRRYAEAADVESRAITKLTAYESRTLAEDAMREEELLKYGVIDFTKQIDGDLVSTNSQAETITESGMTKSDHVIEDALSVQPINQDRRTTLYIVGSNYKPMKRLEVQPSKPFVRDPDDNSWRNESISSLGIVFKPKNSSSKSFKEVLKTKTEIELSNSQDKDNKGEAPELRERLEKITEVRKRKKKIDKSGEVVYTDYEEGSSAEGAGAPPANIASAPAADIASSPAADITSAPAADTAGTSSPGADIDVTSPMTTTKSASYWINQLEKISKDEMYKDLGLEVPTTHKPKKPYNLAEYYDTTDDYDVDYMTMPNIDIKKYTVSLKPSTALPPRATSVAPSTAPAPPPPSPATRRPLQFPDRQPTLQYFPPTTRPPKISMNEYDVDFENRIKAYTQQTPRPAPVLSSERLRMRPTVRPSDFTMSSLAPRHLLISSPGLERGSFVIRHLGDFLGRAAAREEDARAPDFPAFIAPSPPAHEPTPAPRDYDGEPPYRRDVVDRFVDSFNLESDRFNVEFPILVNSSVLHRAGGAGEASSSTFMKRLLGGGGLGGGVRGCSAGGCERLVELSPSYELHYYVPEQEERAAAEGPEREAERADSAAPYGAL